MSRPSDPVGMTFTSGAAWSVPSRMIAPFPNCFSMVETASSIAFSRGLSVLAAIGFGLLSVLPFYLPGLTFLLEWRHVEGYPEQRDVFRTSGFHATFIQNDFPDQRRAEL